MNGSLTDEQLWNRIQEIRGSYKDAVKLQTLLNRWEEEIDENTKIRAEKMMAQRASEYWASIAVKGNSLNHLIPTLWEDWTEGDFTIKKTDQTAQINCTKCPMADAYKAVGKPDLGMFFHCDEDPHMVSGFNPHIEFKRTKTLMEDDCCDHFYQMMS